MLLRRCLGLLTTPNYTGRASLRREMVRNHSGAPRARDAPSYFLVFSPNEFLTRSRGAGETERIFPAPTFAPNSRENLARVAQKQKRENGARDESFELLMRIASKVARSSRLKTGRFTRDRFVVRHRVPHNRGLCFFYFFYLIRYANLAMPSSLDSFHKSVTL